MNIKLYLEKMEINKHYFDGICKPGGKEHFTNKTFSVGIFQAIQNSSGKGLKRSPVKVRVSGLCSMADMVYSTAKMICEQLDNGSYCGKKSMSVKSEASK